MGFMEGFANGFGRQMELGQQERAQNKRDTFQIAYDSYMNNKKKYDSDLATDTQTINSAKAIASSVPGIPEGSWEHAYKWLQSGYTPGQVEDKLRTAEFASQESPAMPDNTQSPEPLPDPQQAQMVDSGLAPGQAETTGQQDPDILGSSKGQDGIFFSLDPKEQERHRMEQANGRVAGAVNDPNFDAVNAGYKPAALPGQAPAIIGTRQLIKSTTGTGVGGSFKSRGVSGGKLVKGSQAAKDHMAKLRAMRGTGLGTKVSVMGGDDEFDGGSFMSR